MKRLATIACTVATIFLAACAGPAERIVIGVCVSREHQAGAQLAVEEINASGGIDGIPVELAGLDWDPTENFDPRRTLSLAKRFTANPELLAVVGPSDSRSAIAVAPFYNRVQIPQIITIASNPSLTNIGPWTYRLCLSDSMQGPGLADYAIRAWHKRRFAVLFVSDQYGHRLASLFQQRVRERGGEIMVSIPHRNTLEDGDRELISRTLTNLEIVGFNDSADVLVLFQRQPAAEWTAAALAQHKLTRSLLASDSIGSPTAAAVLSASGLELRATVFFAADSDHEPSIRFIDRFQTRFGEQPHPGAAFAYDAIYLIHDAIRSGGASREGIRDAIDQLIADQTLINGVTGRYQIDLDHDARRPLRIGIAENGRFQSYETIRTGQPSPPDDSIPQRGE